MTDEQRKAISVIFEKPISDNELIAEFMGFTYYSTEHDTFWNPPDMPKASPQLWKYHSLDLDHFYPKSWDWLMSVVEKIETLGYDTGICHVLIKGEKLTEVLISPQVKKDGTFEIHLRNDESKLVCTYKAVVEFIRMYNLQNKQ